MPLYSANELAWLKVSLRLYADRLRRLVRVGAEAPLKVNAEVDRVLKLAGGTLSDDAAEFWGEEYYEAKDMGFAIADLTMVAINHWVERQTKVHRKRLAKARLGSDLPQAVHFAEVNVMRLFANAWKHDADQEASTALLTELGLAHPQDDRLKSTFSDETLAGAMARFFGLGAGTSSDAIVERAVDLAFDHLMDLASLL